MNKIVIDELGDPIPLPRIKVSFQELNADLEQIYQSSQKPPDVFYLTIEEYVAWECREEAEWDEWHLWQLLRWTVSLWPEGMLRRLAVAVAA